LKFFEIFFDLKSKSSKVSSFAKKRDYEYWQSCNCSDHGFCVEVNEYGVSNCKIESCSRIEFVELSFAPGSKICIRFYIPESGKEYGD